MYQHWRRTTLLLSLSGLCAFAAAQTPAAAPQTYALVAAMGDQFGAVSSVPKIGSNMEAYRRQRVPSSDILNRIVLQDLDQTVSDMDPASTRVFMSMTAPNIERVVLPQREQYTIDAVIAELKKHEQERRGWNRIIVVTPAYRAQDKNQMATNLQGMGVFVEPLCQVNPETCDQPFNPRSGPMYHVEGSENTFAAPYSYLAVWQLDPATLQVIGHTRVFRDDKTGTPQHTPGALDKHAVATQMTALISSSIRDGLKRSDQTGHVEVINLPELPPSESH